MLRIAIIVTPMGRDLGVLCKICSSNIFLFLTYHVKNFCSNIAKKCHANGKMLLEAFDQQLLKIS
jgi:hypothetical protein